MDIKCHTTSKDDIQSLREGPQVIVGTPGRVHDMIQRQLLLTDSMKILILDKTDEILSVRFIANPLYCTI